MLVFGKTIVKYSHRNVGAVSGCKCSLLAKYPKCSQMTTWPHLQVVNTPQVDLSELWAVTKWLWLHVALNHISGYVRETLILFLKNILVCEILKALLWAEGFFFQADQHHLVVWSKYCIFFWIFFFLKHFAICCITMIWTVLKLLSFVWNVCILLLTGKKDTEFFFPKKKVWSHLFPMRLIDLFSELGEALSISYQCLCILSF